MPNATFTGEATPPVGGPGTRWYKPSAGEWYPYNMSTEQWDLSQDGFATLDVVDLAVSGSVTTGDDPGITGTFEGAFKKIKIKNGIITEFELED